MKRILVTGAGGTPSWNFIKSVQEVEPDIFIVGTDSDKYYIHRAEEVNERFVVPRCDSPDYIDKMNELIEKYGIEFIHVQPDVEVAKISKDRDMLNARVFMPDKGIVELCHNKYKLIDKLIQADVPAPKNVLISTEDDLEHAFNELGDTLWIRAIRGAGGRGSLIVKNTSIAKEWINYWDGWGNFSAEEYLPGRNFGWASVYKDGEFISAFPWERLNYIIAHVSPSGITGTPDISVTVTRDDVEEIGKRCVETIDPKPNGIYSVDFRENKDGVPAVTEINPGRFFTPSYSFTCSGVNLPEIYLKTAYGEELGDLNLKFDKSMHPKYWVRGIDYLPRMVDGKDLE
jgi:carbamoyl-phosphate synthase large subunit